MILSCFMPIFSKFAVKIFQKMTRFFEYLLLLFLRFFCATVCIGLIGAKIFYDMPRMKNNPIWLHPPATVCSTSDI